MAYRIEFEEDARKSFKKLDNSVKKVIQKYLDKLESREDPRSLGDPIESNLAGLWRYRVGDYRIVAEIQDDVVIILILVIEKRATVYKITDKKKNK